MTQVYSLKNVQAIAMVREQLTAEFYKSIQKQPELNNYEFVKILNKYVTLLNLDQSTNLSLSNQDIDAYINYLQFQAMLMGQKYQISQQDRMTLQVQLTYAFNSYPLEQKQALAFTSFQWNVIAHQWAQMNPNQQQQYIAQVQSQLNIENVNIHTSQEFWNHTNSYESNYDFASVEQEYRQQAAAKGMNMQQYLDYKQRDMAANQQLFTTMQNITTENHVSMMNIINNMGDSDVDYYYTDYNNNY